MISFNPVSVEGSKNAGLSSAVLSRNEQTAAVENAALSQASASAVVELSGSLGEVKSSERRQVSRENAQQMAFDIAALLPGSMGVQSNVNAFDAARLLAD